MQIKREKSLKKNDDWTIDEVRGKYDVRCTIEIKQGKKSLRMSDFSEFGPLAWFESSIPTGFV